MGPLLGWSTVSGLSTVAFFRSHCKHLVKAWPIQPIVYFCPCLGSGAAFMPPARLVPCDVVEPRGAGQPSPAQAPHRRGCLLTWPRPRSLSTRLVVEDSASVGLFIRTTPISYRNEETDLQTKFCFSAFDHPHHPVFLCSMFVFIVPVFHASPRLLTSPHTGRGLVGCRWAGSTWLAPMHADAWPIESWVLLLRCSTVGVLKHCQTLVTTQRRRLIGHQPSKMAAANLWLVRLIPSMHVHDRDQRGMWISFVLLSMPSTSLRRTCAPSISFFYFSKQTLIRYIQKKIDIYGMRVVSLDIFLKFICFYKKKYKYFGTGGVPCTYVTAPAFIIGFMSLFDMRGRHSFKLWFVVVGAESFVNVFLY
jgi:hypothetical protein